MSPAAPIAPLAIGVALATNFERRGDSLADARAFEAAGCDSLWLTGEEEPWLAAAVIAVVTTRVRLVVPVTAADVSAPDFARRLATMQRLAGSRFGVCCAEELSQRVRASGAQLVFCAVAEVTTLPPSADGVIVPEEALPAELAPAARTVPLWVRCSGPADRKAWQALLAKCQHAGATGAVVPQTSRLLDLLRNPDQDGDRSDLQLAHG